jgi:glycerol-3-phosphate dehydrogenase (NAD(P)+)
MNMASSKSAVIGAGAWGTAIASVLAEGDRPVSIWSFESDVADDVNERHENRRYLPASALARSVRATTELTAAVEGASLVVLASPSHVMRGLLTQLAPLLPSSVPIVCATKGIENGSLMTMSEVCEDVLPPERHPYLAYLSGPSFAKEVAQRLPTAVVVASRWERVARQVQEAFARPWFRVYTSSDVMGVELGGALKNVIAIAAGASDGLGFGHNARSALITRGIAEMSRLALRKGANPLTMSGLAGVGDLVLTCTGELSRNRQVGMRLSGGERPEAILASMTQVAEGVRTAKSVHDLARRLGVDMPICERVYEVLFEGVTPREAVARLMARELKPELG